MHAWRAVSGSPEWSETPPDQATASVDQLVSTCFGIVLPQHGTLTSFSICPRLLACYLLSLRVLTHSIIPRHRRCYATAMITIRLHLIVIKSSVAAFDTIGCTEMREDGSRSGSPLSAAAWWVGMEIFREGGP